MTNMEYYSVLTGIQTCENIILKLCFWNFYIFVMILKFHIQHYLNNSKKWHKQHSLAANFTYGTLKSGLDLQCTTTTATTTTPCTQQLFLFGHCNFSTTTTASTGCAEDDYSCEDYVAEDHYKDWYPDKSEYDFEDYDGEYDDEYTATITNTTTSPITTNTRVPK